MNVAADTVIMPVKVIGDAAVRGTKPGEHFAMNYQLLQGDIPTGTPNTERVAIPFIPSISGGNNPKVASRTL